MAKGNRRTAPPRSDAPAPLRPTVDRLSAAWLLLLLLLLVLAAYHPAWHGGMLWDDDGHLTRSELRPLSGLWRIWFDLGATQQYYPLVHSAFWLMDKFWGTNFLGYHIVNIVLHATSAFLLVLIFRRLAVPGALLIGVAFALHPVHVESVAWMTELKNTLSGALYLGAALAYLHFDRQRTARFYVLALGLFLLALCSKTVVATLPAGLLVVFWWQRGRLNWPRDIVPLLPFVVFGVLGGVTTAWVEHTFIGASGADFNLRPVERCLVAGRAIAFYLGKIAWPTHLMFIYPRWQIRADVWSQYLYPIGVCGLLGVLWSLRRRSRAPLAALLFFCVTLSPALGFVDVYPFKYSFVADHFQYLASISIIAIVAAACARVVERWRAVQALGLVTAIAVLGTLTWNQSRQYVSAEALFRETLRRNPSAWMAHSHLALLELARPNADTQAALAHFNEALRLSPNEPLVHDNLGILLMRMGRLEEALEHHKRAVQLAPGFAEAYGNLGADLQNLGRLEEAVEAYREALHIKPDLAPIRSSLGLVLARLNRPAEAETEIRETLRKDPVNGGGLAALGDVLLSAGRADEAIARYQAALRVDPLSAHSHGSLGHALSLVGRLDEAVSHLREAVRLAPNDVSIHHELGNVLQQGQHLEEAVAEYQTALRVGGTTRPEIWNDCGVALARLGRRSESIAHFRAALRLQPDFPAAQANLTKALGLAGGR